jgi:hypothetical protein
VQGGTHYVQIGIYLTNDLPLKNLVIPLVLRSVAGGAFFTKVAVKRTAGARIGDYLTAINLYRGFLKDSLQGCFTYIGDDTTFYHGFERTPSWVDTSSHSVVGPPVGALISCGRIMPSEPTLPAGSDSTPSFHLLVDIDNSAGEFVVDTVCIGPFNHLVFVAEDSAQVTVARNPSFTKGVITVICTKVLPEPSGSTPVDAASDLPTSVTLKWSPVVDSCADPVTYDVFFGSGCDSLALKCGDISVDTCLATGLSPNTSYYWKVMAHGTGDRQTIGPCWSFKVGTGSAVQYLGGDGLPRDYALDQNYPNPFNASTVIKFNTKHDGHVRIDVYNIIGQKVRTLVDEFRHYGPQAADWDGTDAVGKAVPTGLYFYRLVTSDFTDVKKMVLLK